MAKLESEGFLRLRCAPTDVETPVVLMLHGFFGHAHNWHPCAEALSKHTRVLVPQLPFFGVRHDVDTLERIACFLDELVEREKARRLVVLGNSFGGQLAINMALRRPDRVLGLVLTGSSGLYERNLTRKVRHRPEREWVRERITDLFHDPSMVTEGMVDEVIEMVNDRQKTREVLVLARRIRATNLSDLLPHVQCPVSLVWGADDKITPPGTANDFHRLLPNAELHFLPRCGHAPMMECPDEFNRLVKDFVFRLSIETTCVEPVNRPRASIARTANMGSP